MARMQAPIRPRQYDRSTHASIAEGQVQAPFVHSHRRNVQVKMSTLVAALLLGIALAPWDMSRAETRAVIAAREVYRQQCSKCHGLIVPEVRSHGLPEPSETLHVRRAAARFAGHVPAATESLSGKSLCGQSPREIVTAKAPEAALSSVIRRCRATLDMTVAAGRRSEKTFRTDSETWLAFAPPYGPPLRGVYGRPAGSVAGFNYSSAFKQALQGVVWDEQTLNVWLTNSQKRAPGSLMFYRQPEAEIRRQIILYLRANR
jgi:cytochrome c2